MGDWVDATVGIAGYGSIGRQIARTFTALGAKVHAYTASPRKSAEERADRGYIVPRTGDPNGSLPVAWYSGTEKADLHTFLRSGLSLLVICLPLTPATMKLFGKAEFEILRDAAPQASGGCVLVNIARGGILDQAALVDALNEGVLRGACLDVTSPEPLPREDPLWRAKNVVVTPHVSGLGKEYVGRAWDVCMLNLQRLRDGEKFVNEVRRGRGY
jgi:phosphoglycerate dehydrogenase-like enzyme